MQISANSYQLLSNQDHQGKRGRNAHRRYWCRGLGHGHGLRGRPPGWGAPRDPLGRAPEQAQAMQRTRTNPRYLPDVVLPAGVSVRQRPPGGSAAWADLLIIGTPMAGLRSTLHTLAQANVDGPGGVAVQRL